MPNSANTTTSLGETLLTTFAKPMAYRFNLLERSLSHTGIVEPKSQVCLDIIEVTNTLEKNCEDRSHFLNDDVSGRLPLKGFMPDLEQMNKVVADIYELVDILEFKINELGDKT